MEEDVHINANRQNFGLQNNSKIIHINCSSDNNSNNHPVGYRSNKKKQEEWRDCVQNRWE